MVRKSKEIDHIDIHIGQKIYSLRLAMGWSRQELASQIDVSLQQVQKYEIGTNRVSAGRLVLVAKAFNKPIEYFYADIENDTEERITQHQRMCIEISRNFMKIKNSAHQEAMHTLIKTLASED